MSKLYIQNLAMIVTNKCNLNCTHCLRGTKDNNCMSDEVIEATLNQVFAVGNLSINGGEPLLALDRIEKHIPIDEFTITINGTIYSEELLKLFDEVNNYIGTNDINALLAISLDNYHFDEIRKLGIQKEFYENLKKYQESKYFYDYRNTKQKLFREGYAVNLEEKLTVPLRPLKPFITYVGKNKKFDKENGICNIGPIVTINPKGIITECDASIGHQEALYNYGNVLCDSIEEVASNIGELVLKPKTFERKVNKSLKKYWTYKK